MYIVYIVYNRFCFRKKRLKKFKFYSGTLQPSENKWNKFEMVAFVEHDLQSLLHLSKGN